MPSIRVNLNDTSNTTNSEKVCPWCNRVGHVRRSHNNCGMKIQRRVNVETENILSSASDIINSHNDNPETINSNTDNRPILTTNAVIVCPYCGREGHQRRNHFNCGMNSTVRTNNNLGNIARDPEEPETPRNYLGGMDVICTSCQSYMWIEEKKSVSSVLHPRFQSCCADGKAIIEPYKSLPSTLTNLFRNNDSISKEFKKNLRTYNSALSFTSMNADLDKKYSNNQHGAYAFRIHGSVYHLMSENLTSNEGESSQADTPKFAQIYIFDSDNELQNRMNVAGDSSVSQNTMLALQNMMHEVNPFVNRFKTMKEISDQQPNAIRDIKMIFRSESTPDPRRYNSPTASEIGVLIVGGDDDEGNETPKNRDIVLRLKGTINGLQRINEINQHYDPLQYVLMFPFGDPGWHCALASHPPHDIDPNSFNPNGDVTIMQYYSSRLMIRKLENSDLPKNQQVGLHSFGKLFHQYVVDMYAKMEQQRLNYIRFNQESLRAAVYNGLRDAIHLDDSDMSAIGKKIILPSTFIGGPRFMAQLYQDAMNLVRRFGKPDLFITFTCNPTWPEIINELLQHQVAGDRPDLCARVFNLKLKEFLNDILKKHILGKVVAYVYSIEFQKRGLPHCHMLFILNEADKPKTPEDVDRIVSAEIPNPLTHPLAYNTVTTSMVHGPCGLLNPSSPCMKNGKCSKRYPHDFSDDTVITEDGKTKLVYRRRRMNDRVILRNGGTTTIDNRWIVPHNLYLAAKYDAHINVEICSQITSIQYVYKYVYKGHDRAQVLVGADESERQDEIKNFLDARYVSAAEACWRLLSFPMHKEYPSSQRLDVHLENERQVFFHEADSPEQVLRRQLPESTLTAWFKYNKDHPNDIEAKDILYPDFCEKYTFHKQSDPRVWKVRKGGFGGTIGRVYSVSPRDTEKFHLRMLLYKMPGATCFNDLKKYNGIQYLSFQATARAMGLLSDDTEWSETLYEASRLKSPKALRQLFAILIAFCELSDPFQLWSDYKNYLAADYLYKAQQKAVEDNAESPLEITEVMFNKCLLDLNDILAEYNFDLKIIEGFNTIFPENDDRDEEEQSQDVIEKLHSQLYAESLIAADPDTYVYNASQKIVYETIRDCALAEEFNPETSKVFFVDGPGGTGKTFLFNALLDAVRRTGNIAISVASSGTAALLLKGGRTAHSTFNIPLNVTTQSTCNLTPRSKVAEFIAKSRLIVWDECSMISKYLIETVDRTFRDILKVNAPFGGLLVVFGGDFRQVLPVIRRASRAIIVSQCLNKANFWSKVVILKLEINMRVQQAISSNDENLAADLQKFADYLLDVGEGKIPNIRISGNIPTDFISIPQSMHLQGSNLKYLISQVYSDIQNSSTDNEYYVGKAILTAKNKDVVAINNLLLQEMPSGAEKIYFSIDKVIEERHNMNIQVEYLNSIETGSLPPHKLELRVGCPIMTIRNIYPSQGVCNGTRLIVRSLGSNVIEAMIATGPNTGDIVCLPRIKFICAATEGRSPHDFARVQFPIRLAFAMTINKAQGQTLSKIGLYLPDHVFGHGQLYVAMSRVRTPASIKIMIDPEISKLENKEGHYTHNIVFKEVFHR